MDPVANGILDQKSLYKLEKISSFSSVILMKVVVSLSIDKILNVVSFICFFSIKFKEIVFHLGEIYHDDDDDDDKIYSPSTLKHYRQIKDNDNWKFE